ncbi:hypothetical protein Hanom_Chr07g00659851 [Helianthus anomalus]
MDVEKFGKEAMEPASYVFFEDQDFEVIRPYLQDERAPEKCYEDPATYYDPEVLKHAWDYDFQDEEDD